MSDTGTVFPGSVETHPGDGTLDWANTNNVKVQDGSDFATADVGSVGEISYDIYYKDGDFSAVPNGSSINGIVVSIWRRAAGSANNNAIVDYVVQLLKSAVAVGDNKADTSSVSGHRWPTNNTRKDYGGPSDGWNAPVGYDDLAALGVRVAADGTGTNGSNTASIDAVAMTIYFTAPAGGSGSATWQLAPAGLSPNADHLIWELGP